jgi:Protein of unknown function (DUF4038)/Putative collagen-binding domain of a collagenase
MNALSRWPSVMLLVVVGAGVTSCAGSPDAKPAPSGSASSASPASAPAASTPAVNRPVASASPASPANLPASAANSPAATSTVSTVSSPNGTGELRIEPQTPSPGAGQPVQFTVSKAIPVLWGLAESTSPAADDSPVYPLKVSDNHRYLVDQRDRPWRVQADAAWLMSSEATTEQVDTYLDTRRAQGFNSFYLMAMVHPGEYRAAVHAPNNSQGDPPFAKAGDFSTAAMSPASERYWAWIDSIIDKAASRQMVVMLAYTYLGYNGGKQGWYREILAQKSSQALFDWGNWLGQRFKDKANLIWFGLGDFSPPAGSEGAKRSVAIAEGIRSAGATQPLMAEPSGPDALPGDDSDFGPLVDMNSFYGYGPGGRGTVYETADRAWRSMPVLPAWMQEGTYEYENDSGNFQAIPWETRRGRFWSVLSGGTAGDGFGSKDAWQWQNMPASLSTPGATFSTYAFDLFQSMPWWELQPSGVDPGFAGTALIPSGQGTAGGLDFISAAATTDHKWLVAYVPVVASGTRNFSVDMSALDGPVRARWFDPAAGDYLAISGGYTLDHAGATTFTTPAKRSDGTDDWLLVLDSSGAARCGTITVTGRYTAPQTPTPGVVCRVTATVAADPSIVVSLALN